MRLSPGTHGHEVQLSRWKGESRREGNVGAKTLDGLHSVTSGGCTSSKLIADPLSVCWPQQTFLPWRSLLCSRFFTLTCFASKVVILETLNKIKLLFSQKERRVKIRIWPFVNNYFFCNLSYT